MLSHRAAALRPAAAAARTALRLRVLARSAQSSGLPTSRASVSTWTGASRRSPSASSHTHPDPRARSNSHSHSGSGTGARRSIRGPYNFSGHSADAGGSATRTSSSSSAWLSDESSGSDSAVDEPIATSGRRNPGLIAPVPAVRRAVRRANVPSMGMRPSTSSPLAHVSSPSLPPFAPEPPAALVRHAALHSRPYSTGKAPPPSVLKEHLRMNWPAYAAVAGCVTLGGWYFYTDPTPREGARGISTSAPATFSVRSKSQGGGYKVVTALAPDEVDNVLRAHERSTRVDRPPGACRVARFDTNSVASNAPCEDKRAEVIVERDWPTPSSQGDKGDLCFFAVMDGHAGAATSTLLAQKLIPFVALELDKLFRQSTEYAQVAAQKNQGGSWLSLGGLLGKSSPRPGPRPPAATPESDPDLVERALRTAFLNLDKEICATPVELLHEYEISLAALPSASLPQGRVVSASSSAPAPDAAGSSTLGDKGFKTLFNSRPSEQEGPSLDARQKAAYAALRPAMHGSCALLTYIDSARGDVYVACTGDSRAVGGFWDAKAGVWTFEPLSVDQTGRNLDEVARMRSEHPPQEADQVIMRGRVLGGLEPTRAFGDAVYKWDRSLQERLYDAFVPGGVAGARRIPRLLRTPPYVTPEPLVQVRRLAPLTPGVPPDTVAPGSRQAGKQLRFIVMATDGLWDMLPNEEVGALVAGHLAGLKGDVRADALLAQVLEGAPNSLALSGTTSPVQAKEGDNPLTPAAKGEQIFTFADENLSTHLIRNALGGAHRDRVAGLLAIPSPESRRYRDDMTVNVILLHDEPVPQTLGQADGEPTAKL